VARRLVGSAYSNDAIQSLLDLFVGANMRMEPEQPRVSERETILERANRRHGVLHAWGAVHRRRHSESVPMDRRLLRQRVVEMDDELVALLGVEQRAGDVPVVGPDSR